MNSPAPTTVGLQHDAALDGIRALAIVQVLVRHFLPVKWEPYVDTGRTGVTLFFVLSGFLITSILLEARRRIDAGVTSLGTAARAFYARRALRILPLYLITVAGLWLVDSPGVREEIGWHLTYTTNVLMYRSRVSIGTAAHFWSLAVEEQFYLLWPCLVLLLPYRRLGAATIALMGTAVAWRLGGGMLGMWPHGLRLQLPSCLDALGCGAWLAWMLKEGGGLRRARDVCLAVGVPLLVLQAIPYGSSRPMGLAHFAIKDLGIALGFGALLATVVLAAPGPLRGILSARPVVAVGRISYGLYLLHPLVAVGTMPALLPYPWLLRVVVWTALSLVVCVVSWNLIEEPALRLKRFVPYGGGGA